MVPSAGRAEASVHFLSYERNTEGHRLSRAKHTRTDFHYLPIVSFPLFLLLTSDLEQSPDLQAFPNRLWNVEISDWSGVGPGAQASSQMHHLQASSSSQPEAGLQWTSQGTAHHHHEGHLEKGVQKCAISPASFEGFPGTILKQCRLFSDKRKMAEGRSLEQPTKGILALNTLFFGAHTSDFPLSTANSETLFNPTEIMQNGCKTQNKCKPKDFSVIPRYKILRPRIHPDAKTKQKLMLLADILFMLLISV